MAHSIMVPGPGNYNPHVRYYLYESQSCQELKLITLNQKNGEKSTRLKKIKVYLNCPQ